MFKFAENKLTIQETWKSSWQLYKQTVMKVWYVVAVAMLIVGLDTKFKMFTPAAKHGVSHFSIPAILVFVLMALLNIVIMAVVLHRIYGLVLDGNIPLSKSINVVISKLGTILLAMVLCGIGVYVGTLLFLIPGIFVFVLIIFVLPYILFDNLKWWDAIKASLKLVWGNWWHTFVLLFVPVAIIFFISILLTLAFSPLKDIGTWLGVILVALVMGFVKPYIDAVIIVLFKDLKLRQTT